MQSGSAREEKRETGRTVLMLSLFLPLALPPSPLLSSSPRPQNTHSNTRLQKNKSKRKKKKARSPKVHSHLLPFTVRNWRLLSGALRGRAWRLVESAEIEAEEGDEKVEEDVCDEGRKKIERLKEWIPC